MKKTVLLLICSTMILLAKSSLWKITQGDNVIYLGGTIHLLRPDDFPLPSEFDTAYNHSQQLLFETDMSVMESSSFQQKMQLALIYTDGSTLKDYVSAKTYQMILDYFKGTIPEQILNRSTPAMIALTVSQLEMSKYEMAEEGVDHHYYKKAVRDGKETGGLETPDEQIAFIASMGNDDPDGWIQNSIDEVEDMGTMIADLVAAWRQGDTKALEKLVLEDMREKYPSIYKTLLLNRNSAWLPKLNELLTTEPVEFVLVGAGHLVGEGGVLALLKESGCTVEQLN
jgi:uncharacterized protein YbaP (TraB family)